jgi:hypothetical protein
MLNLRFKNPYRSDESGISDMEDVQMANVDIPCYNFVDKEKKLVIFEYDQRKVLAPKGIINIYNSKNLVERLRSLRNRKIFC